MIAEAPEIQATVIIRVDGSVQIGTGHVMRCLTLADAMAFRGISCLFLARNLTEQLVDRIVTGGHRLVQLTADGPRPAAGQGSYGEWLGTTQEHDAAASVAAITGEGGAPLLVIVDHYGLDEVWEKVVAAGISVPIFALDDLERRHECVFLLDTTFGKPPDAYQSLVPAHCRVMIGSDHALLRPDFLKYRVKSLERLDRAFSYGVPVRDILISMGGADARDATGWMIDGLAPLARKNDVRLHALVGAAYPHGAELDRRASGLDGRLEVYRDIKDVAALLARVDLCVGASGSSVWERCCLGIPAINLVLAENQTSIGRILSDAGIVADGGVFEPAGNPGTWSQINVEPLLYMRQLQSMSLRAREVVDGYGVQRVLGTILGDAVRRMPFSLRRAELEDAALIYEWQCHPNTRLHALNPAIPSWEEHLAWIKRKLDDPSCSFHISTVAGIACGVVRLDRSTADVPPAGSQTMWREISILTAPEFYGCSVASRSLQALQSTYGEEVLVARVLSANHVSQRLFANAGFKPYSPGHFYWSARS